MGARIIEYKLNLKNEKQFSRSGEIENLINIQNDYQYELSFPKANSILVPKKSEYNLKKYVSKSLLKEVDPNIETAVEKCLVILANFASTYYDDDKWKSLSSRIMDKQTKNGDNTYLYSKILNILKVGTKKGPMIEVAKNLNGGEPYKIGESSKRYRLTESYLKGGLVEYIIKNETIVQNRKTSIYNQLKEVNLNPICSNLIKIYPSIVLPTVDELLIEGKALIKSGYTTKKGKILTLRNKNSNSHWSDVSNRSFVEDNIKHFTFLTSGGYMLPSPGNEKSGGRIVDSFVLMPSWIRNLITIDGENLIECDYTALHPNIAVKLYAGAKSYITHTIVSEEANINSNLVKIEHLSFFNKKIYGMKKSPLYDYYFNMDPAFINEIIKDKKENRHKITSKKLFKIEVEIMSDVIKELNGIGIYVLYVYDALLCRPKDLNIVREAMNRIVLVHGVKTTVKSNEVKSVDINVDKVDKATITFRPNIVSETEDKTSKIGYLDLVNLTLLLPNLGFTVKESVAIIMEMNADNVRFCDLIKMVGKMKREQQYNDYNGVVITNDIISNLKNIIRT